MDPLSDVLSLVRLTGAVFLSAEFTAPWSVLTQSGSNLCAPYMPDGRHLVNYHLVTEGGCYALLVGMEPIHVTAGDLILFPHGDAHVLASEAGLKPVPTADLLESSGPEVVHRLAHGGGGDCTRMVCGFLACDMDMCRPLLLALPRILKISAREGQVSSWIEASLRCTLESAGARAGGGIVQAKLAELLFVEALQRYIETLPTGQKGWLAGLGDPYVGRALTLMHARPAHPWSVDELGRGVALSRSALATRFVQILGQPPMNYLAAWRMQLAAQLLITSKQSVAAVAETIGYDSEPAFHRAFKRAFGVPPAAFRRRRSATHETKPVSAGADRPTQGQNPGDTRRKKKARLAQNFATPKPQAYPRPGIRSRAHVRATQLLAA